MNWKTLGKAVLATVAFFGIIWFIAFSITTIFNTFGEMPLIVGSLLLTFLVFVGLF